MTDHSSIPNILSHITVRLECKSQNGQISVGTGFHFKFEDIDESIIVTNRHVVEDAVSAEIKFTNTDGDGEPDIGNYLIASYPNFHAIWLPHPDPSVDLAAIPVSHLGSPIVRNGKIENNVYLSYISDSLIPSLEKLKLLRVVEDVLMVGYPIGLWDSYNNMPIFRRGITATKPGLDYNGRKEFVIDAACFPGSSGSPVFRYVPQLPLIGGEGVLIKGCKGYVELLGILYAGPQFNAQGSIDIVTVPTQSIPIANTSIPTNLGFVIRSEQILKFKQLIRGI